MWNDFLYRLSNSVSDAIIGVDSENKIRLFNSAAETALGVSADEMLNCRVDEHFATKPLTTLFDSPEQATSTPTPFTLPSGAVYQARLLTTPEQQRLVILSRLTSVNEENKLASLMSGIVHEIKTPLTSAKLAVDVLAEIPNTTPQQLNLLKRAQVNFEYMLVLVHELLNMAWMEAGNDLVMNPTDLVKLTRDAVRQIESYAEHHGVDIQLDLPDEPCYVKGDVRRLEGVLSNLLSNAIKYSPKGGPVNILMTTTEDEIQVEVADQGLGIPVEQLPKIFERFFRVKSPETERIEGSGLGLSLVKAVVEKHGGQVSVQSEPAVGSTFAFRLPRYLL